MRYLGSVVIVSLLLGPTRLPSIARTNRPGLQCLRSTCLLLSTICSYVSLCYLSLTEMTTLTFVSPLLVPLLAGPFLGEKIGPRRITAIIIGFAGVLVVTRPGFHAMSLAVLLPLTGAGLNAFYNVTTRKLSGQDTPETTLFYTGLVGAAAMLPVLGAVWTTPATLLEWVLLALIGTLGALAHWLLILAHKYAPASLLAPFFYTQLLGAALIGTIAFGELPGSWTLLGGGIIIASGLYVFYREQAVRRTQGSAQN